MSFESLLEDIKGKLVGVPPIGSTVKFVFKDDSCVYLDGTKSENTILNEDKEADCTIKLSKDNFEKMVTGKLSPMTAFMTGKLKVEGSMGVAMKLTSIFG